MAKIKIDVLCAIAGIVALVSLAPFFVLKHFNPIYLVAEGVGLAGIVAYLVWFRKPHELIVRDIGKYEWIYAAVVCYILTLVVFVTRSQQYVKPTGYYIFIGLSVSFAILAILKQQALVFVVLGLAIAIGLTHIWTENMMFPSILGLDPWTHKYVTENLTSIPSVLDMGGGISLMHVFLKGVMLTGMSYKIAALICWGSIQTVGIIVLIFLIGRELVSKEVGLISALMVSSANWVIFFGEWVIPNGMGVAMSLLVAYLFIKAHKLNKPWIASLSLIVLGLAFLTHLIASAWVVGTMLCMSLIYIRERKAYVMLPSAFSIVGLGGWYLFSGVGRAAMLFNGGTYAIGTAPTLGFNYIKGFSWEMLLNASGMFLYFGMGVIGLLILSKMGKLSRVWVLLIVGVLAIGMIPPLFNKSLIEHRWWYFADALVCVPLAFAIASIYPMRRGMAVVPCAGALVFLSTIGLPSNTTNRTLSPHQIVRYALTSEELEALPVARSYHPKLLGSDPLVVTMLVNEEQAHTAIAIDKNILTEDFVDCPADVIVLRDAIYKEPFGYGSGAIYNLKFNPVDAALKQGYTEVWHNSESHVLVRK